MSGCIICSLLKKWGCDILGSILGAIVIFAIIFMLGSVALAIENYSLLQFGNKNMIWAILQLTLCGIPTLAFIGWMSFLSIRSDIKKVKSDCE